MEKNNSNQQDSHKNISKFNSQIKNIVSSKTLKRPNSWLQDVHEKRKPMTLCGAFCSFMSGNFYAYSQHKIAFIQGETVAGTELRGRLQGEFQNLGVVSALLFGGMWSQTLGFGDVYPVLGVDIENIADTMTVQANIFIIFTTGAWAFSMLSMALALCNLILINLLLDQEIITYIRKTSVLIKAPFQLVVLSLLSWMGSLLVLYVYIVPFSTMIGIFIAFAACGSSVLFAITFMNQALHNIGEETVRNHLEARATDWKKLSVSVTESEYILASDNK